MAYNVEQLKSLISEGNGLARSNLYAVSLPNIDSRVKSANSINLLCRNVQLPARQLNTTQAPIGLVNKNIGNGIAIQDITMTFRMLNDPYIKNYFDHWQSLIVDPKTYEVGFYRDYVKPIKISMLRKSVSFPQLSKKLFEVKSSIPSEIRNRLPVIGPFNLPQGEIDLNLLIGDQVTYEVELIDAYPTSVLAVDLDDMNEEGLSEITVSFTYKNWKTSDMSKDNSNPIVSIFTTVLDKIGIPTTQLNTSNKSEDT